MKKLFTSTVIGIISFLFCFNAIAQVSFTNKTADLMTSASFNSGVAIAIVDVNGDHLDDIVHLNQGTDLVIDFQNITGGTFTRYDYGNIANNSQWSMCAADINNDGYNDIMAGGSYDDMKVIMANASQTNFSQSVLPGPQLFLQGSNFADINNDGHIDLFGCHDDAESRIWGNDGNGNLVEQDSWIDMTTNPMSDNSGNYGSVWTDFDNDGDIDLYIAKCRQGVNDDTDPRRINALYVNDGNGNYTEDAATYGLKIGAQSWTADFADVDNDGDFDCFITNHDAPSQLLLNDGNGYFTDVTATSGIDIVVTPIQGIMEDFNNDGFVDLLIAGGDSQYFQNDGDGTFTQLINPFDDEDMESFAIGDLNHDGYLDIYGGYATIYTNPSNVNDAIWINEGNDNNFFAVNTVGTVSNKSGIGARVSIYGEWGVQIREVRAGESYGIMNSLTQHFGLGSATSIDSLVINWPSGIKDVVINPSKDQFVTVVENTCTPPNISISATQTTICTGETTTLTAPSGFAYIWSTGATSQSITVNSGGVYSVQVNTPDGCSATAPITIIESPDESPTITADDDLKFCEGEGVTLTSTPSNSYLWSTGETTQSILASAPGDYDVTIVGTCGDYTSNTITIENWAAPTPTTTGDLITAVGTATLTASGAGLINWYNSPTGGTPIGTGNTFVTPIINTTTTYYAELLTEYGGQQSTVGKFEHTGTNEYASNNYEGGLYFDAYEDFILKSVYVYTDTPGEREVEIVDNNGNVLNSVLVDIPDGEGRITLDLFIEAGTDLEIRTNAATNQTNFGFDGPRLRRNENGTMYPYVSTDFASITTSVAGDSYYYYFYDWEMEKPTITCSSELVPVVAQVDLSSGVSNVSYGTLTIYPNPTTGKTLIETPTTLSNETNIEVMDISGRWINLPSIQNTTNVIELDLSTLAKGMYMIRLTDQEKTFTGKVTVQ